MNPIKATAMMKGQQFAAANPSISIAEVEKAAPRFNPARTAFIDGASSVLKGRLVYAVMPKETLYDHLGDACIAKDRKTIDLIAKELASR
jgi:hypothetical protein